MSWKSKHLDTLCTFPRPPEPCETHRRVHRFMMFVQGTENALAPKSQNQSFSTCCWPNFAYCFPLLSNLSHFFCHVFIISHLRMCLVSLSLLSCSLVSQTIASKHLLCARVCCLQRVACTRERSAHRAGWARVGSGGSLRDEFAGCHDRADERDLQEAMISPDSNDVVVPACEAA